MPFPAVVPPHSPVPLGTIVTMPDPRVLELCVLAGCDWLFVDCEHGAIALPQLGALLAGKGSTPALVRLPADDEQHVKQALDAGCEGIICPRVEDAETVRRLVDHGKYPPLGSRSVGIGRAHGYGLNFSGHLAEANESTSVVVQIESEEGVRNLDEILAVPGLGGVFIGPYDLSGSMGVPGQVETPAVRRAVRHVVDSCKEAGVPVGQFFGTRAAFDAAESRDLHDFAAIGIDTVFLATAVADATRPSGS
ncbi:HpcH/HpaI aldolase family protein [Streptomyces albidus (ex Kaewkla and Franco 2022)]|uniref:HpcH/HpaI aldolase family protein n=1 Tax=Streptomyces albidus (ex Kaewkla and Franco 2022) TaxID=722709 RepID=UPI0015EFA5E1|nr:aldolase/citrate lyase family protein [Streptomyces albidus (ex Kaewkla and Franco 2022)]